MGTKLKKIFCKKDSNSLRDYKDLHKLSSTSNVNVHNSNIDFPDEDREEDGFVVLGETAMERSTVLHSTNNFPPTYEPGAVSVNEAPSYDSLFHGKQNTHSTHDCQKDSIQQSSDHVQILTCMTGNSSTQCLQSDNKAKIHTTLTDSLSERTYQCCIDTALNGVPFHLHHNLQGLSRNTSGGFQQQIDTSLYNYDFHLEHCILDNS